MANKRNLKKNINFICGELFAECVAMSLYDKKKNKEDINAILDSIIITNNDYVCRISHPEPGMEPKSYFKRLRNDFDIRICEIIDNITNV